jgi:hypothetical protein
MTTIECRWYLRITGGELELGFLRSITNVETIENVPTVPFFENCSIFLIAVPEANNINELRVVENLAADQFTRLRGLFEVSRKFPEKVDLEMFEVFEKRDDQFFAHFSFRSGRLHLISGLGEWASKLDDVWELSSSDQDVRDVLWILGNAPLSWCELYNVYEICFKVLNDDDKTRLLGSSTERNRFTGSANHQGSPAGLNARHSRMLGSIKDTMDLDEATSFIFHGILKWLSSIKGVKSIAPPRA